MLKITKRHALSLFTLAALVPLAHGGLSGTASTRPQQSKGDPASKEERVLRRKTIESRSGSPTLLELEQLEALGYVDATYDPRSSLAGVLRYEETRTKAGYNFYTLRESGGARLIDMRGDELHRWQTDEEGQWLHAELVPNGDVIVTVVDQRLSRYDKDSRPLWSVSGRFHHDFWIHDDDIFALSRVGRVVKRIHPRIETLVDLVQVVALDGTVKREISVLDAFMRSPYRFLLPSLTPSEISRARRPLDVLHVNHIEVFDGSLVRSNPIYARGNILLSARNINAVFILDGTTSEILWIWGPTNLTFQHQPTLLENGHLLIFDNGLTRSRVIEVEPLRGEIVWTYAPDAGFFSRLRGGIQRLSSGNTLITESDTGYVREITRRGDVVWEFANPAVNSKEERAIIWRMTRIDPETLTFLDGPR